MTLRPVGSLPPGVYWRRRLLVLVPLLFLIGLTTYVACSPSGAKQPTARQALSPARGSTSPAASTTSPGTSAGPSASASPTPSASATATTPPTAAACPANNLMVAAATSAPSYPTGSEPVLYLQVTNIGAAPCSQDLADSQVELQVYNGTTRVWGSHDCKVEPGTSVQTLAPNQPVRLSITWTGLSSQPGCAGERGLVPAGTYTLNALLAGVAGTPATFTLT